MITLDHRDRRPLYLQIIAEIENLVLRGVFKPHQQLPSVRNLALELSINPNTIQRAYLELENRNIIYSIAGKGSFINPDLSKLYDAKQREFNLELEELVRRALLLRYERKPFLELCASLYKQLEVGENHD